MEGEVLLREIYRDRIGYKDKNPFKLPETKLEDGTFYYRCYCIWPDIVVSGPEGDEVEQEVRKCVRDSAILAAIEGIIVGYVSGVEAGVKAALVEFVRHLRDCLRGVLGAAVDEVDASIDLNEHRGEWTKTFGGVCEFGSSPPSSDDDEIARRLRSAQTVINSLLLNPAE